VAKRRKRTNKNVPAKGRLREICDSLWSLAVRADWAHKCAACGKGKVDAHHLIPRQHEAYRYDLRNGIALCGPHHQFDADISPHQNAAGWLHWLNQHRFKLWYWYIDLVESGDHKSFTGTKNAAYYIGQIRRLKEYVDEDEFTRVVGVRFSAWLEENSE